MKAGDIKRRIEELEERKRDVDTVLDECAFGYARELLENASAKIEEELNALLDTSFEPKPYVVKIRTDKNISLEVGQEYQLTVNALLSNGSSKDITKATKPIVSYRDYDNIFNNIGFMLSVTIDEFYDRPDTQYHIKKTVQGWDVTDNHGTRGLYVEDLGDNVFEIRDYAGNSIGITFITDGNEAVGDDWVFDVKLIPTGTEYIIVDPEIASITSDGLITAVEAGTTTLEIYHGGIVRATVNIEVTDPNLEESTE